MPWTVNAEIYPMWARSTGNAMATATNWTFSLIIALTFLTLSTAISRQGIATVSQICATRKKFPHEKKIDVKKFCFLRSIFLVRWNYYNWLGCVLLYCTGNER
jgi:hypothetical protein